MACQAKQARAMLEQDTTSKSRQILMALAAKLQEKEAAMEQVNSRKFHSTHRIQNEYSSADTAGT